MSNLLLKNGYDLIIRTANINDAHHILNYMNFIGEESNYLTFGKGEWTIHEDQEIKYINSMNESDNSLFILGIINNTIVGSLSLGGGTRSRTKHKVDLGITVRKPYWGLGIGNALMNYAIDWAKENKKIKKIDLLVRTDNEKAINLYNKYGFSIEGTIKRDLYIGGEFFDAYSMGLLL